MAWLLPSEQLCSDQKKKKSHCVLCKMVLRSVSWSIQYLNIKLCAKHLGCLRFKECRMPGGNEGDGARVEIQM